ncbi:MAG TPA: hypothetical protein PK668_00995 [Myxococcota bacterium]|nr:hypothetical protein [Myxococcota bacterium]HRY96677.1 hypothetical protein [Myxococcota bacterium]HSA20585.1 hypothetical protein [Myxococcota bacterium]
MTRCATRIQVAVVVAALCALLSPATGQARTSLAPLPELADAPSAFELSLTGGAELAWVGPARASDPQAAGTPLLRAAELSLPGEVIEDVLLERVPLAPSGAAEALADR